MTTKKHSNQLLASFLFLVTFFFAVGCEKSETEISPTYPIASFETDLPSYEENEPVQFINTSENGESFVWIFGDGQISFEKNPVLKFKIPGHFIGAKWTAKLLVYSKTGHADSTIQHVRIGKRYLRYLDLDSIAGMQELLSQYDSIKISPGIGVFSDPGYWEIYGKATFQPAFVSSMDDFPVHFYWPQTFPVMVLFNDTWFLKIYRIENGEDICLKTVYFNPAVGGVWDEDRRTGTILIDKPEARFTIGFENTEYEYQKD